MHCVMCKNEVRSGEGMVWPDRGVGIHQACILNIRERHKQAIKEREESRRADSKGKSRGQIKRENRERREQSRRT